MDRDRIVVAEILRPRGLHGELVARSQTDVPGRLENLKRVNARITSGADIAIDVSAVRKYRDNWVFKFVGVDSIEAAQYFAGADLWVPLAERGALPEGEWFESDLIGCAVVDGNGERIGVVQGWQRYGGPVLMEVNSDGKEVLIPFVEGIYREVDLVKRVIRIDPPEGLLSL